jgi:hypothetical protein
MDLLLASLSTGSAMPPFFHEYPYLLSNLLGLIPLLVLFSITPRQRLNTLIAGVYWLPLTPLASFHNAYWSPARLGRLEFGIEDALYLFNVSTLGWLLSMVIVEKHSHLVLPRIINCRRYLLFIGVGCAAVLVLLFLGVDVMTAHIAANCLIVILLIVRFPKYWILFLSGSLLLTIVVVLEQKLWFFLWPEFLKSWNAETFWGRPLGGVPLGEVVFHLTFAVASPLGVSFCREASLVPLDS